MLDLVAETAAEAATTTTTTGAAAARFGGPVKDLVQQPLLFHPFPSEQQLLLIATASGQGAVRVLPRVVRTL